MRRKWFLIQPDGPWWSQTGRTRRGAISRPWWSQTETRFTVRLFFTLQLLYNVTTHQSTLTYFFGYVILYICSDVDREEDSGLSSLFSSYVDSEQTTNFTQNCVPRRARAKRTGEISCLHSSGEGTNRGATGAAGRRVLMGRFCCIRFAGCWSHPS